MLEAEGQKPWKLSATLPLTSNVISHRFGLSELKKAMNVNIFLNILAAALSLILVSSHMWLFKLKSNKYSVL